MPIYEYRRTANTHCEKCVDGFEVLQKMAEEPLTACSVCGTPVKRVVSAVAVGTSGPSLSRENLEKHGFTQYRKSGSGVYEKTAGKGPDKLEK